MTTTQTAPVRPGGRTPSTRSLEITVLAGGCGPEREVSLHSGHAVLEALRRLGHRARICDVAPGNLTALDDAGEFVFIALHGEFGEDGTLQAELDRRGIRYSGSGAQASRLAMDKAAAKRRFMSANIPTPPYEVVTARNRAELAGPFPLPAVVKPVDLGSSVDITIARTPQALEAAVEGLIGRYGRALVEGYIAGPELTVGVLGDQPLPVCEIRTPREFYDYEAKYLADTTEYLFTIDLPAQLLRRVQQLSVAAHQVLGCRVFSRVDWMVDGRTRQPFVLEVNTIPGFTSHSLLPKAAARVGLSFDQLCQRIIDLSLADLGAE